MNKLPKNISLIICILLACFAAQVKAQLITDSESRLNTVKVPRQGFSSFARPSKSRPVSSGALVIPRSAPRPGFYALSRPPRYTQGNPYGVLRLATPPRTSQKPQHDYFYMPVRYSSNRTRNFDYQPFWTKANDPFNARLSQWSGPYYSKLKMHRDMLPMNASNRKWYLMIVKLTGNNSTPEGVKEKVPKPKFDRKEREIWNN